MGKTALSIELARALNGEIVSADSRLIYQGMNIGVAKPSVEEQRLAPHHLLDLVPPDRTLSLARYQQKAYAAIDDILQRGHLPLMVGGTGQYVSAVIEGWGIPEVPPDEGIRAELELFAAREGSDALHARLHQHDPQAAKKIHPNNVRRVIRALEVFMVAGRPITELQRKSPPPYRVLQIGLSRMRKTLYKRIDERIDRMMEEGLLEEVKSLLAAGFDRKLPALSGLGYAQLIKYHYDETTLEEAVQAIKSETRSFARRQDTWFRKYNKDARWFEVTENATETIIDFVRDWLESGPHATS